MNRLIPVGLVLLVVGCSGQPPASAPSTSAAPTLTSEQAAMLANGKRLMASLPKDFQAELVSAEFRYLKPRDGSEAKAADAAAPLVIRIRFTNGDDTLDSSGWSVVATAKDEFGNTITGVDDAAFMSQRTAELNETHDIPPGKAAVRTFVFSKPIPKATAVTLSFGVSFPRRPSSIPFGPTLKVPLPAAK